MTKREAAIVSAYTGCFIGDFRDFQEYTDELFGESVPSTFILDQAFLDELEKKSKPDFIAIEVK